MQRKPAYDSTARQETGREGRNLIWNYLPRRGLTNEATPQPEAPSTTTTTRPRRVDVLPRCVHRGKMAALPVRKAFPPLTGSDARAASSGEDQLFRWLPTPFAVVRVPRRAERPCVSAPTLESRDHRVVSTSRMRSEELRSPRAQSSRSPELPRGDRREGLSNPLHKVRSVRPDPELQPTGTRDSPTLPGCSLGPSPVSQPPRQRGEQRSAPHQCGSRPLRGDMCQVFRPAPSLGTAPCVFSRAPDSHVDFHTLTDLNGRSAADLPCVRSRSADRRSSRAGHSRVRH